MRLVRAILTSVLLMGLLGGCVVYDRHDHSWGWCGPFRCWR
jgi:hypothetical protein